MTGYVACIYHTPNHAARAEMARASLVEFGIDHHIEERPSLGGWEANTRIKPEFIRHCLWRFPDKNVLYLDADAVVRAPLDFLNEITADVALTMRKCPKKGRPRLSISAGTVFVKNTPGGWRFVDAWIVAANRCGPFAVDEDMIYEAFRDLSGVSITPLPESYYAVFDRKGIVPVIEHFQESRNHFKWGRMGRVADRMAIMLRAPQILKRPTAPDANRSPR